MRGGFWRDTALGERGAEQVAQQRHRQEPECRESPMHLRVFIEYPLWVSLATKDRGEHEKVPFAEHTLWGYIE